MHGYHISVWVHTAIEANAQESMGTMHGWCKHMPELQNLSEVCDSYAATMHASCVPMQYPWLYSCPHA